MLLVLLQKIDTNATTGTSVRVILLVVVHGIKVNLYQYAGVGVRDRETPTAAFRFRYSELAVDYPVFQKRLWLVFQFFPYQIAVLVTEECISFTYGIILVYPFRFR